MNLKPYKLNLNPKIQPTISSMHGAGSAPGVHGEHQAEGGVRVQHARAAARRAGLVQQQLAARLQQRVQPVQHLRTQDWL